MKITSKLQGRIWKGRTLEFTFFFPWQLNSFSSNDGKTWQYNMCRTDCCYSAFDIWLPCKSFLAIQMLRAQFHHQYTASAPHCNDLCWRVTIKLRQEAWRGLNIPEPAGQRWVGESKKSRGSAFTHYQHWSAFEQRLWTDKVEPLSGWQIQLVVLGSFQVWACVTVWMWAGCWKASLSFKLPWIIKK